MGVQRFTVQAIRWPILNSEPQNFEEWFRFALSFLEKQIEYITSTFDIHDSIFAF
ncbi:hypothetical protein D1BOALGB6SA_7882 [Olavius sp. associated proteobacterium Delta 1]|nr:hypothetical protein D1BOALGB6SA_7882 [Olavius sp. associated proteobacterium Delta 1]